MSRRSHTRPDGRRSDPDLRGGRRRRGPAAPTPVTTERRSGVCASGRRPPAGRRGVPPVRRAGRARHQAGPHREPGGLPGEGAAPVGPAGRLGPAAEPGLRLPLPRGAIPPGADSAGVPAGSSNDCGGRPFSRWASSACGGCRAALGSGDPWARYVAALLYALGPRFLVGGRGDVGRGLADGRGPLGAAATGDCPATGRGGGGSCWSALAFALTGGVNAVASGPRSSFPTLWFAHPRTRRSAAMRFATWLAAVVAVARRGGSSRWSCWGATAPRSSTGSRTPPSRPPSRAPSRRSAARRPGWDYLSGAAGPAWPAGWQFVTLPALRGRDHAARRRSDWSGCRLAPRRHRTFLRALGTGRPRPRDAGHTGVGGLAARRSPCSSCSTAPLGSRCATPTSSSWSCVSRSTLGLALSFTGSPGGCAAWDWRPGCVPRRCVSAVGSARCACDRRGAGPSGGLLAPFPATGATLPRGWMVGPNRASVLVVPAAGLRRLHLGLDQGRPAAGADDQAVRRPGRRAARGRRAPPGGWTRGTKPPVGDRRGPAARGAGERRHPTPRRPQRPACGRGRLRRGQGLRVHEAIANAGFTRVATFGPPVGSPPGMPQESVDGDRRPAHPSAVPGDRGLRGCGALTTPSWWTAAGSPWFTVAPRTFRTHFGPFRVPRRPSSARTCATCRTSSLGRCGPGGHRRQPGPGGLLRARQQQHVVRLCRPTRTDARGGARTTTSPIPKPWRRSDAGTGTSCTCPRPRRLRTPMPPCGSGPGYGPRPRWMATRGPPGCQAPSARRSASGWTLDLARTMDVRGLTVTLEDPPRRVGITERGAGRHRPRHDHLTASSGGRGAGGSPCPAGIDRIRSSDGDPGGRRPDGQRCRYRRDRHTRGAARERD